MKKFINILFSIIIIISTIPSAQAAKMVLIIDDFGYRKQNEEQIILLSPNITISVLPNSPNAANIASFAHNNGNDVMIHLPMAPLSRQQLESDTLTPTMEQPEIDRIIAEAVEKVPYAIGCNNHMGSKMTASLEGMYKVMESLAYHKLFFIDSRTTSRSKAKPAAARYEIPIAVRDIFLDDEKDVASIAYQFDLAVNFARKTGNVVVIGHPYDSTLQVLEAKLAELPDDIELVKVSSLVDRLNKLTFNQLFSGYQNKFKQSLLEYLINKQMLD